MKRTIRACGGDSVCVSNPAFVPRHVRLDIDEHYLGGEGYAVALMTPKMARKLRDALDRAIKEVEAET